MFCLGFVLSRFGLAYGEKTHGRPIIESGLAGKGSAILVALREAAKKSFFSGPATKRGWGGGGL